MSDPLAPPAVRTGLVRAVMLFTVAQAAVVALAAWALQRFMWPYGAAAEAVRASAVVAVVVQVFTFAVARLVARQQVIAGWGVGVLMRFAAVAAWGLVGAKALGLPGSPALLSLVLCFFLSTLLEPLFLHL
ncbi:MAG: hypothetical protein KJT01_14090 [Gemmatimonadetes bacterium]|nr:hypothetical protein [Gemmatimonadota bacterium]